MERDALFTDELREETRALNLRTVEVDVGVGVDELINVVADCLDLRSKPGRTGGSIPPSPGTR
jgi:hypothetical protein